ncbi:hypothetical protein [Methylobacterium nigriterrae]|uniref:hypothetical protein n=1 Tax=Methylobacterium nigriterrae TaxID=3127512 RepID=UPI0030134A8E
MSGANAAMMSTSKAYRGLSNLDADLVVGSLKAFCAENGSAALAQGVERFFGSRPVLPWPPQP